MAASHDSPFMMAATGQVAPRTPVWFMRQAGRSLPEYRELRGSGSILEAIKQPDLAAQLTLQPVTRYGVDVAVLFSDIVVPAHAIGFGVDVTPGTGPVVEAPFRSAADIRRLRPFEPDVDAPYVAETIRLLDRQLDVPILAFAGAPFTVASYLVEGRPSKKFQHTKALMRTDEAIWHLLMSRLSDIAIASVRSQLDAGAQAFQLFDSWAGAISRSDYERFVLPHSRKVFQELASSHPAAPGIHFGVGCDHLLELMHRAGPAVIGLDWRTSITEARDRLGAATIVQGNLDPALVLSGADLALAATDRVLLDNAGHAGHIFNLGHGVDPATDPDVLAEVVARVHERTAGSLHEVPASGAVHDALLADERGAGSVAAG